MPLQQYLPLAVLKPQPLTVAFLLALELQQYLPLAVLKRASVLKPKPL